jgi:hypothetical protein
VSRLLFVLALLFLGLGWYGNFTNDTPMTVLGFGGSAVLAICSGAVSGTRGDR